MSMKETIGPMVHHKSKQPQIAIVDFLTFCFVSEIKVQGMENLKKTQDLIAANRIIIFAANHLSHVDFPIFDQALKRNGFKPIAEKTIPLEGRRVDENPATKPLVSAYNTILVWPPTIEPQTEKERQKKFAMDKETLKFAKRNVKDRYHLFIFPEGTRSKTGILGQGQPKVAHFFTLANDTFVVPIGISGTEKILPPGNLVPWRDIATVNFGEPISVSYLTEKFGKSRNNEMRKEIVDTIMREIAKLLPPQYRGVYT